jgi:hypothetical protein
MEQYVQYITLLFLLKYDKSMQLSALLRLWLWWLYACGWMAALAGGERVGCR